MPEDFINSNNSILLDENSRDFDLFNIREKISVFENEIKQMKGSRMVALVGPYGSGKSTFLNILKNSLDEAENKWLTFDAWKYPDKKDIWEGFVLDICEQVDPSNMDDINAKIQGTQKSGDILIKNISDSLSLILAANGLPYTGQTVSKLGVLRKTSKANRINDFQEILRTKLGSISQDNIFIVTEDIDRSGSYGTIFLETIRNFLDTITLDKKVTIIVPIDSNTWKSEFKSYEKFIDSSSTYSLETEDFINFLEHLIHDDFKNTKEISALSIFFSELLKKDFITVRTIKLALRNAQKSYKTHMKKKYKPNFAIEIGVQISKFIFMKESKNTTLFNELNYFERRPAHPLEASSFEQLLTNITQAQHIKINKFILIKTEEYYLKTKHQNNISDLPLLRRENINDLFSLSIPEYYFN